MERKVQSNDPERGKGTTPARADSLSEAGGDRVAFNSLWRELRERKVIRVATVYAIVGWGVIVGSLDLSDILDLPTWVPRVTLLLIALGFPVALVLAWAFEVTSDGVHRAPVLGTATGRPSRAPLVGVLLVAVGSLGFAAFMLRDVERPPAAGVDVLDAERVAVLPFHYTGPPDQAWLGDGIATLLNSRFTGNEIGPRAANATTTAALWAQVSAASPSTAERNVAERLGARLVLSGSVFLGSDGADVSATMRDLVSGEELTASAGGPVGSLASLTALVERLAGSLLTLSLEDSGADHPELASADFTALKEYHQGQAAFRRGRFEEAYRHFVRAVEIDPTFALAWIWVADAGNNVSEAIVGQVAREALERAWQHRERLDERDSAYLVARRLHQGVPEPSTREETQRAYLEASRLDPTRANVWYFLGENTVHRPTDSESYDEAREYFERTLELDPENANGLLHLFLAQTLRRDPEGALDAAERLAALDSTNALQRLPRWIRAVVARDTARAVELYDSVDALASAGSLELNFMDQPALMVGTWQAEALIRAFDRLGEGLIPGSSAVPEYFHVYFGLQELGRPGQALDALAEYEAATGTVRHRMRVLDAIYGALPDEVGQASAAALEARLADVDEAEWSLSSSSPVSDRTALELWRVRRGELSGVVEAAALYRRIQPTHAEAHQSTLEAQALLLEATAGVRRGDPGAVQAVEAVDELLVEGLPALNSQVYDAMTLATAEVFEALGEPDRALQVLERESNYDAFYLSFNARFARERGRLAALTGDTARAIREYEHYVFMRAAAAPALQPELEEVRSGLRRLR